MVPTLRSASQALGGGVERPSEAWVPYDKLNYTIISTCKIEFENKITNRF